MIDLAVVAVGIAVGVCVAAAFCLHRRDAELLHALGELRDERAAGRADRRAASGAEHRRGEHRAIVRRGARAAGAGGRVRVARCKDLVELRKGERHGRNSSYGVCCRANAG